MSPLEIIAAMLSAAGVWLLARRSLWSWPVSLVGVVLYGWIFFVSKLYSDMLLQVFFGASCVYGWAQWKKGEDASGTVTVAKPALKELALGGIAGVIGAVALGYLMARYTDAAAPWVDATLTSFSFVAQIWTARRFIESWWLWIALDVVYICLYLFKHLYPTSVLYAVYIVLCIYGAADWLRGMRAAAQAAGPIDAPEAA